MQCIHDGVAVRATCLAGLQLQGQHNAELVTLLWVGECACTRGSGEFARTWGRHASQALDQLTGIYMRQLPHQRQQGDQYGGAGGGRQLGHDCCQHGGQHRSDLQTAGS